MLSRFSCVRLYMTPWTVACQAPLSMGLSRQKYWRRHKVEDIYKISLPISTFCYYSYSFQTILIFFLWIAKTLSIKIILIFCLLYFWQYFSASVYGIFCKWKCLLFMKPSVKLCFMDQSFLESLQRPPSSGYFASILCLMLMFLNRLFLVLFMLIYLKLKILNYSWITVLY